MVLLTSIYRISSPCSLAVPTRYSFLQLIEKKLFIHEMSLIYLNLSHFLSSILCLTLESCFCFSICFLHFHMFSCISLRFVFCLSRFPFLIGVWFINYITTLSRSVFVPFVCRLPQQFPKNHILWRSSQVRKIILTWGKFCFLNLERGFCSPTFGFNKFPKCATRKDLLKLESLIDYVVVCVTATSDTYLLEFKL